MEADHAEEEDGEDGSLVQTLTVKWPEKTDQLNHFLTFIEKQIEGSDSFVAGRES